MIKKQSCKNKAYIIYILFIIMYIIQFIVMPILKPKYYPTSNNALDILYISLITSITIGMIFVSDNMKYWLVGDILYILLIWIYPAKGAYGTGLVGIALDGNEVKFSRENMWIDLLVLTIIILLLEMIVKGLIMLFKRLKRN